MIKGVSKTVVELNQPDSAYFERVVFYLKPNLPQIPPQLLRMEALQQLQGADPLAHPRQKLRRFLFPLLLALAFGSGMLIAEKLL